MTNTFTGALLLLTDPEQADELAAEYAANYFPDKEYHYTVTDATPTSFPDEVREGMADLQLKAATQTQVLTLYPWAASGTTLPERPTNGTVPR
jgi:ABC-type sugar transport system substrate-binding protein